jgi:8-oxo-dGTP pyrophosphatase MutT (NUDIX family)
MRDLRGSRRVRVVIVCDQKVLLQRRWYSAGAWQLPGGGVRGGETLIQAAVRELREELGWTIAAEKLELLVPSWEVREFGIPYSVVLYAVRLDNRPQLDRLERGISEIVWLEPLAALARYARSAR